jgi:hypothetical protein
MAAPSLAPQNMFCQQGNRQVTLIWDLVSTATSYQVQRSTNGVTYANYATSTVPHYTDTVVVVGTQYWYQVAGVNVDGTGPYSSTDTAIPAPNAELSLYELRLRAKERADRVNSNFVTDAEWNFFLNQASYELYDLLINTSENYFEAPEVLFTSNGTSYLYPLPDGATSFVNSQTGATITAPPFYKLLGVDLGVNNATNAYVSLNNYNLIDRNRFVYPNTASTIYGIFNLQYRLMGTNIRFIPTPASGQQIRLLYAPRLPQLMLDTDLTAIGYSGWLQYVIIRAAKYALDKEESDTSKLDSELVYLKGRIEETAQNQDQGQPDRISDIRSNDFYRGRGGGSGGYSGSF